MPWTSEVVIDSYFDLAFLQKQPLYFEKKTFYCENMYLCVDIVRMDPQAFQKNQKRHFFRDIQKSFQEITPMVPEPHLFFLFKISQQIWLLDASKVSAKMDLGWQAV